MITCGPGCLGHHRGALTVCVTRPQIPSTCHRQKLMIHTFTDPRGHTHTHSHTHTQRLAEDNCQGSSPARLHPPLSPREGTSEQGSECRVGPLRSGRSLKEACGREGFSGRGNALLEVLNINGKAFSLPCRAAERLSFIFHYLSRHKRKDNVKETCNRNISRKGEPKQLQSNPWQGRCLWNILFETKQWNIKHQVKTQIWYLWCGKKT